MVYLSSDFHLGHRSILKYREGFETLEEHDNMILDQMASLSKRDVLMVIGDFIFDGPNYKKYMDAINKMPLRIKLIMGNHDSLKLLKEPKIEVQLPLFTYKNKWISHCPIHPQELRRREGNIHGHLHGEYVSSNHYDYVNEEEINIPDPRYFNVCLDNNNNKFVPYETIKEHYDRLN